MSSTYSPELEERFVASIIQNGNAFPLVDGIVESDSFGWTPLRILWKGVEYLGDTGVEINPFSLKTHFDRTGQLAAIAQVDGGLRGAEYLDHLGGIAVDSDQGFIDGLEVDSGEGSVESMGRQLQETFSLRTIVEIADKMKGDALDGKPASEILGYADDDISRVAGSAGINVRSIISASSASQLLVDSYKAAVGGESRYIETGIKAFDNYIGGLSPGKVIIPAATSGAGKTTFSLSLLYHLSMAAGENNIPSGILSMEMDNEEISGNIMRFESGIDPIDILKGKRIDMEAFGKSLELYNNSKIHLDDSPGLNLPQIRTKLRKLAGLGCKFVVIDQLDLIDNGYSTGYADADVKVYRLKSYAREFGLCLIVPHQLNKSTNSIQRKNPFAVTLADLKESGEKGADGVMFIRTDPSSGRSAFIWTKARQGQKGIREVEFDMKYRLYSDIADSELRPIELSYEEDDNEHEY